MEYEPFPDLSPLLNLNTTACERLIRRAFTPRELLSLVEVIFSNKGENNIARCLRTDDAQTFADVIYEVRFTLPPITKSG